MAPVSKAPPPNLTEAFLIKFWTAQKDLEAKPVLDIGHFIKEAKFTAEWDCTQS